MLIQEAKKLSVPREWRFANHWTNTVMQIGIVIPIDLEFFMVIPNTYRLQIQSRFQVCIPAL